MSTGSGAASCSGAGVGNGVAATGGETRAGIGMDAGDVGRLSGDGADAYAGGGTTAAGSTVRRIAAADVDIAGCCAASGE
ncbi:MAG TPA: hypothetical protein VF491_03690 [Vicinamibacterales bacterium]